jgi:EEF1A lysine methyltransferase 4
MSASKRSRRTRSGSSVQVDVPSYSDSGYWDSRYDAAAAAETAVDDSSIPRFEWYYSFEQLKIFFEEAKLGEASSVLEIGCGDVPMISSIECCYGCHNCHAIDFSSKVIKRLKEGSNSSQIVYSVLDARAMAPFTPGSFDFIVDKGTIDAMLSDPSREKGLDNAERVLSEIVRVLATDGIFMMVSHIQIDSKFRRISH